MISAKGTKDLCKLAERGKEDKVHLLHATNYQDEQGEAKDVYIFGKTFGNISRGGTEERYFFYASPENLHQISTRPSQLSPAKSEYDPIARTSRVVGSIFCSAVA